MESRREQLERELEQVNEAYWDAQLRLNAARLAKAAILNLIMELDDGE